MCPTIVDATAGSLDRASRRIAVPEPAPAASAVPVTPFCRTARPRGRRAGPAGCPGRTRPWSRSPNRTTIRLRSGRANASACSRGCRRHGPPPRRTRLRTGDEHAAGVPEAHPVVLLFAGAHRHRGLHQLEQVGSEDAAGQQRPVERRGVIGGGDDGARRPAVGRAPVGDVDQILRRGRDSGCSRVRDDRRSPALGTRPGSQRSTVSCSESCPSPTSRNTTVAV